MTLPDADLSPLENLAVAIIRQACEDYKRCKEIMRESKTGSYDHVRAVSEFYCLQLFFESDWCGALTYGRGEKLLKMLKKGLI